MSKEEFDNVFDIGDKEVDVKVNKILGELDGLNLPTIMLILQSVIRVVYDDVSSRYYDAKSLFAGWLGVVAEGLPDDDPSGSESEVSS